jgi:DNA-binding LacI/PurR family transcriptional regulator
LNSEKRIRNIVDLAELAGVTAGTVSRALSNSPLISEKTRKRIQALAEEHDFRPNAMARNLRIQRTGAIGVLIPLGHEKGQHISDPFFITMLGHLADELTERGYDLMLSRVIPSNSKWLDIVISSGRVDGAIIIGQSDQAETIDRVAHKYRPLVTWGGYQAGQVHCSVGSDNFLGGRLATEHLLRRGCKHIAFFGDSRPLEIAQRLDGCRAAMVEAGLGNALDVRPVHLVPETANLEIRTHMEDANFAPDGIFAASDGIAMSSLQILSELGRSVPDDVAIVGYDDLPVAAQLAPPLTTVKQDIRAGAEHLVSLLLRRIAGEDTDSVIMPPTLTVRKSA